MTEGSSKNDVSAITDRGLWLRFLKKTTHRCEWVMGRTWAVWVAARGDGLFPPVWKAKIDWPYAAGTGETGDG